MKVKLNKKIKIMVVFGTRPEAIKMAPLVHKLKLEKNFFDLKVCVTAQHRQMLDQMLNLFEIVPDIDLNLMKVEQDLSSLTSLVIDSMKNVLIKNKPDLILVHGDTTTTMSAAMAGFYAGIAVGHVEAGLRTYNLSSPFPEEFNRQVTSKIAKWHFAPTLFSKNALLKEGIHDDHICVTGNTVIDSLNSTLNKINIDRIQLARVTNFLNSVLDFNWQNNPFILITSHRRENFGENLIQICKAIRKLASLYPKFYFVYPVHLNSNISRPVYKILKNINNVLLIDPLDYQTFSYLMKYSYLVLTDSGGIQEEAPNLRKPVLVMREFTERPEGVKAGTIKLVGSNHKKIIEGVSNLLNNKKVYQKMSKSINPYGDGFASERIVNFLKSIFFKNN